MIAYVLIKPNPHYRLQSFIKGLQYCGYDVQLNIPRICHEKDIILTWNRYPAINNALQKFEAQGNTVLCIENGYIGQDENGHQLYSIAKNYHNGFGTWVVKNEDRFSSLNIEVKEYRKTGSHILVCPQRGIGSPPVSMPLDWQKLISHRLALITDRKLKFRYHPNSSRGTDIPLEHELKNCWAVVIWGSTVGVKALINGVPVCYTANKWIMSDAAYNNIEDIESNTLLDRSLSIHKMSWAQWTIAEIEKGIPFQLMCT